jgi:hypothetical protein
MKYLSLFSIILLSSCFIRPGINSFTRCYEPIQNQSDTLIRTDGYYFGEYSDYPGGGNSFMFFADGSVVGYLHLRGQQEEIIRGKELHNRIWYRPAWGIYSVKSGKIIAETMGYSSYAGSLHIESELKIINDSILWLISSKGLDDGSVMFNDSTSGHYVKPLKFAPLDDKPDSTCWLKKKKWFWCDKHKYKAYMKKLKEEKRSKKNINNVSVIKNPENKINPK